MVNGSLAGLFKTSRRLRQADLLSPLFFILVMEALGQMISRTVARGLWESFKVRLLENALMVVSDLLNANCIVILLCGRYSTVCPFVF